MATRWGDRDARRRDILAAGRELITRQGYSALQMRDVARGAGISPGTVYTYYPTKEALFAALYADRTDRFADTLEAALNTCPDLEELLVSIADDYVELYRIFGKNLDVVEVMSSPLRKDPQVGGRLLESSGRAINLLRAAVEAHVPPEVNTEQAAALMWATMNGLAEQFTSSRRVMHANSLEELVRFAARTLIGGLASTNKESGSRTFLAEPTHM